MKQNKRQVTEALREAIFTTLGVLWVQQWKKESSTHFEELEGQEGLREVERSNNDHLAILREDDDELDFSHNPERAYDYIVHGLNALFWSRRFLAILIVSFVLAIVLNYLSTKDSTEMSHVLGLISVFSSAVAMLSIISFIISGRQERSYQISEASKYIGHSWKIPRQEYIDVGFVEAALWVLLENQDEEETVLGAKTLPDQLKAAEILRNIFRKHFADVGVPYVETFESHAHTNPERARRDEEVFNSMALLTPYMGFKEHHGDVRTNAYEAARRRVRETNDGPPTEVLVLLLLPFPAQGDKRKRTGGPPSSDPPEPPKAA